MTEQPEWHMETYTRHIVYNDVLGEILLQNKTLIFCVLQYEIIKYN